MDIQELKYPSKLLTNFFSYHIQTNGCRYLSMVALNVNRTNTLIKKFKLHQYKHFLKMPLVLTIEYQWTQKDL